MAGVDDNWGEVIRKVVIDLKPGNQERLDYAARIAILDSLGQPISESNPIPVLITGDAAGTPKFFEFGDDSTPGVEQSLINEIVPLGKIWKVKNLIVVSRFQSQFQLFADGTAIVGGRTGAARPTVTLPFNPERPLSAGVELELLFTQITGTPVAFVEAYLQMVEVAAS